MQTQVNGNANGSRTGDGRKRNTTDEGLQGSTDRTQMADRMRRAGRWIAMLIAVGCAFGMVLAWIPSNVFGMPIQSSDAPGHYYFIRKLMDEGLGAALRLWPNDTFYPPLFHIIAYLASAIVGLVTGTPLGIYAAFGTAWAITSGLLYPIGMTLLCSYFLRELPRSRTRALLLAITPILAVASVCHPYTLLDAGPLIAYGCATGILPYLLYATLRLLDAINARPFRLRTFLTRLGATIVCGGVTLLAHPRVIFAYALIMLPFIVLRMPWRLIAAAFGAIIAGGVAFVVFMFATYHSDRYFHPETWFHTHMPSKTIGQSAWFALSDGLDGWVGVGFALLLTIAVGSGLWTVNADARRPHTPSHQPEPQRTMRRNMIALCIAFLAVGVLYVATVTLTGAIPNIITAPWYRDENRIVTMLPLTAVPLVIAGLGTGLGMGLETGSMDRRTDGRTDGFAHLGHLSRIGRLGRIGRIAVAALLVAVAIGSQIHDPAREASAARIDANTSLTGGTDPVEQLTPAKVAVLEDVVARTGIEAAIISDPMNGSMFAESMLGANMLYPIMNPQSSGNGRIFADMEEAFASGDGKRVLGTACPIEGDRPEYFLTMGDQATSLQSFPYRAQYDMFHDTELIARYVDEGVLELVVDYGEYGEGWALYRFGCR